MSDGRTEYKEVVEITRWCNQQFPSGTIRILRPRKAPTNRSEQRSQNPTNITMLKNWLEIIGEPQSQKSPGEPLYGYIKNKISSAIDSGIMQAGVRLPANRDLARSLGVDRSTIARAYQELAESGYIESHVGRGTFVCVPPLALDTPSTAAEEIEHRANFPNISRTMQSGASSGMATQELVWSERFSRASQTVHEIFRLEYPQYSFQSDTISFAGGIPTEEFYPHKEFEQIVRDMVEGNRSRELFEYSPAEGHPVLRQELIDYLSRQGISAHQEELLVLSGSQQGLDVVSGVLLDPGDIVVTENPTYLWATCSFKARQARCLPVPLDEEGIRLDVLENALRSQRVKFIYVIPNFQNPTGVTMSLARRQGLLKLANDLQVPILEDNFAGDLRYEGVEIPALRAMAGSERIVIHQGTISKALCPALRLGWLVAPKEVMGRLLIAKRSSNLSTNSISQMILAEYLRQGLYSSHLQAVRKVYSNRRDTLLQSMTAELSNLKDDEGKDVSMTWSRPEGGMFVWVRLPQGLSSRELLSYAQREGVVFAPGDICFLTDERSSYMRLCFIQLDEKEIREGITRLARAVRAYMTDLSRIPKNRSSYAMRGEHSFI